MARKLEKNLVALGSAAVVAAWAAGFVHSSRASDESAVVALPSANAVTATASAPVPTSPPLSTPAATAIARAIATATATTTPPPSTSSVASVPVVYRDGTFNGSGSNRFGTVEVAVTVEGGHITDATITRCTTRYPVSRIAGLPAATVKAQSTDITLVAGATYSSRAFRDAVTQALARAGDATGTTAAGRV